MLWIASEFQAGEFCRITISPSHAWPLFRGRAGCCICAYQYLWNAWDPQVCVCASNRLLIVPFQICMIFKDLQFFCGRCMCGGDSPETDWRLILPREAFVLGLIFHTVIIIAVCSEARVAVGVCKPTPILSPHLTSVSCWQ